MHRVELKVLVSIETEPYDRQKVPNAPCGVESSGIN